LSAGTVLLTVLVLLFAVITPAAGFPAGDEKDVEELTVDGGGIIELRPSPQRVSFDLDTHGAETQFGVHAECGLIANQDPDEPGDPNQENNLTVHWQDATGQHTFHMRTMLSSRCDDSDGDGSTDLIEGEGEGTCEGQGGAAVQFTLTDGDAGNDPNQPDPEPTPDTASFTITGLDDPTGDPSCAHEAEGTVNGDIRFEGPSEGDGGRQLFDVYDETFDGLQPELDRDIGDVRAFSNPDPQTPLIIDVLLKDAAVNCVLEVQLVNGLEQNNGGLDRTGHSGTIRVLGVMETNQEGNGSFHFEGQPEPPIPGRNYGHIDFEPRSGAPFPCVEETGDPVTENEYGGAPNPDFGTPFSWEEPNVDDPPDVIPGRFRSDGWGSAK